MSHEDGSEQLLVDLLLGSHFLAPDELPALVARAAADIGASDVVIYLADYDQHTLRPLAGDGVPTREPIEIDATLGGLAFRTLELLDSEVASGLRLWLPLLDGTARLGVLELTLGTVTEAARRRCHHLGALVAELLVSKNMYGDAFKLARRSRELSLPAEMQWDMLPPLTFATPRLAISAILEPSYGVAGDTFDYALNGDTAHVALVDAMGHGFQAALMAAVAVGAYRHSRRCGHSLAETYSAMDDVIGRQFGLDCFVTAQLVELDARTGKLRWLNAGHPAPLLLRGSKFIGRLTCAPTLPIGFGGSVAEVAEEALEPGDQLLFFTDGVVEARSPDGEFFGDERLPDLLVRAAAAGLSPPETVRRLSRAILAHQSGDLQDDATTLLLAWRGAAARDDPL